MKRFVVGSAMFALLAGYCAIVLWLVITGDAAHMMAAALLASAPLVVATHQSLTAAAHQRKRIEAELQALHDDVRKLLERL